MSDKKKVAERLAREHYRIEPGITHIFTFWERPDYEAVPAAPIRLLEVNENTVPSGVMPLYFGASPASGVPYPSVIIEVTPEEFRKIESDELKLPEGWAIREALPRPDDVGGSG
jgi:hypothetical protein